MGSAPLFKFYEVVKVVTDDDLLGIKGLTGAILGMAQNDAHEWSYGVHIFDKQEVWDVPEADLASTGQQMKEDDFYDGRTLKVRVNPKTTGGEMSGE